jgi:hypothetical protein
MLKRLHKLSHKALHSMENVLKQKDRLNKPNEIDIILYCNSIEALEEIYDRASDVMICNKLEMCLIEPIFNAETYYLLKSLNVSYATGEGFPPDAIVDGDYAVLALLSEYEEECPRCWNKIDKLNDNVDHPLLCDRCLPIVLQYEAKFGPLPFKEVKI